MQSGANSIHRRIGAGRRAQNSGVDLIAKADGASRKRLTEAIQRIWLREVFSSQNTSSRAFCATDWAGWSDLNKQLFHGGAGTGETCQKYISLFLRLDSSELRLDSQRLKIEDQRHRSCIVRESFLPKSQTIDRENYKSQIANSRRESLLLLDS
jgi:hypothetical protein